MFVDGLYLFRQVHKTRYAMNQGLRVITDESWLSGYHVYRDALVNELASRGWVRDDAVLIVEDMFWEYFVQSVNKAHRSRAGGFSTSVATTLHDMSPKLAGYLRRCRSRIRASLGGCSLDAFSLEHTKYSDDFRKIDTILCGSASGGSD